MGHVRKPAPRTIIGRLTITPTPKSLVLQPMSRVECPESRLRAEAFRRAKARVPYPPRLVKGQSLGVVLETGPGDAAAAPPD